MGAGPRRLGGPAGAGRPARPDHRLHRRRRGHRHRRRGHVRRLRQGLRLPARLPAGHQTPRRSLRALTDQLRQRPLFGPDGGQLTAGAMLNAVLIGLDDPKSWPDLAGSISAARGGNPTGLLRYLDQLLGPERPVRPGPGHDLQRHRAAGQPAAGTATGRGAGRPTTRCSAR